LSQILQTRIFLIDLKLLSFDLSWHNFTTSFGLSSGLWFILLEESSGCKLVSLGLHVLFLLVGELASLLFFLHFEVLISGLGVVSDGIVGILVTGITLETVFFVLWDLVHWDSLVEDWASLDASNLGGRVRVLIVLQKITVMLTHQTRGGVSTLHTPVGALFTSTLGRSEVTSLAHFTGTSFLGLTSVAVSVRTCLAGFASGSVVLDALGVVRVDLDLSRFTSGTGNTGVVTHLEAFVAAFALVSSWAGASLTRGVALPTFLGEDLFDITFVSLDLSSGSGLDFELAERTSITFTFELTTFLTVVLALETKTSLTIFKEVHALDVLWALHHAHTNELLDLLSLAISFGS